MKERKIDRETSGIQYVGRADSDAEEVKQSAAGAAIALSLPALCDICAAAVVSFSSFPFMIHLPFKEHSNKN